MEEEIERISNYIFENITLKFDYPLTERDIKVKVVEMLLTLKDSQNNYILNYFFESENSIQLDDYSNEIIKIIIYKLYEKVDILCEDILELEEGKRTVPELLKELETRKGDLEKVDKILEEDSWDGEKLDENTKEEFEGLKNELEIESEAIIQILKSNEIITILNGIIEERKITIAPESETKDIELIADEAVLLSDFDNIFKNNKKAIDRILDDLVQMAKNIKNSYISGKGYSLQKSSAKHGNGIHISREGTMYKDTSEDIRIIIVQDGNKFIVRGIVRGHSDDAKRARRFKEANKDRHQTDRETREGYRNFVLTLKGRLYNNPLIQYLNTITQHVLQQTETKSEGAKK